MSTFRWTHRTPRIRQDGTVIRQDDEFEPTELERKCWGDRFEVIQDPVPVIESVDEDEEG